MHKYSSFDFAVIETSKAAIAAASAAALYGKGVFTTIRICKRNAFLWEKHWQRLSRDCGRLGINIAAFSQERVKSSLDELLEVNRIETGRARITIFDRSGGLWSLSEDAGPSLLITTAALRELPDRLRISVSPYCVNSRSSLAGIKSCNYLENIIAFSEAQKRGFDETIRLNETGNVASAAFANIVWTKGDAIYTPPLESGCVAGTMREFLIERFGILEQTATPADLVGAERIFLLSAGIAIAEVAEIEGLRPDSGPNPWPDIIAEARSAIG